MTRSSTPGPHTPRRAVVPAALLLLLSGCGTDGAPATAAAPEAAPATNRYELAIDDAFQYEPAVLTVPVGVVVDVVNRATEAHSVTSDTGAPASFSTGLLPEGGESSFRLPVPGTYRYHCLRHPELLQGTIVVQGDQDDPQLPLEQEPIGGALTTGPVSARPPVAPR